MPDTNDGAIVTSVGRCFEISLMTHAGTGYIWCLTGLPKGVALTEVSDQAVRVNVGGTVRQVFSFLGTAVGTGELTLALLRPWEPAAPGDTRTYTVTVNAAGAEAKLEATAGAGRFIHESFLPSPAVADEASATTAMDSRHNCTMPYGIPTANGAPLLKYGFPVQPLYAVQAPVSASPVIAFYMAQPPRK